MMDAAFPEPASGLKRRVRGVEQVVVLKEPMQWSGLRIMTPLVIARNLVRRGQVRANGTLLETSDGLAVSAEPGLTIVGEQAAEVMLFDLA